MICFLFVRFRASKSLWILRKKDYSKSCRKTLTIIHWKKNRSRWKNLVFDQKTIVSGPQKSHGFIDSSKSLSFHPLSSAPTTSVRLKTSSNFFKLSAPWNFDFYKPLKVASCRSRRNTCYTGGAESFKWPIGKIFYICTQIFRFHSVRKLFCSSMTNPFHGMLLILKWVKILRSVRRFWKS